MFREMKMDTQGCMETLLQCPASSYEVPEGRVFTASTRLADSYSPTCLEIVKPAFSASLPPLQISASRTQSSLLPTFQKLGPKRRAYMKWRGDEAIQGRYLVDLRYEDHSNISHLLLFSAPLPMLARDIVDKPIAIILQKSTSSLSLRLFEALGFEVFCTDKEVIGDFVIGSDGHDRAYEKHYMRIFDHMPLPSAPLGAPERVFIGRRGRRGLENEAEITAFLKSYGFVKVYLEDYTILEQWSLANKARVVVGIHGAALSSFIFNRRGAKLIELFHPGFSTDFFRRIAHLAGGGWCGVFGKMPPSLLRRLDDEANPRAYAFASTFIEPTSLELALRSLGVERIDVS